MSNIRIPPFDLLSGQYTPYTGFGIPMEPSTERHQRFYYEFTEAKKRLEEGFQLHLSDLQTVSMELDSLVAAMWEQGWNPQENNINLFSADFGLVLSHSILEGLGGTIIFRSDEDVSHLSIWWQQKRLEAFPFHKVLKRLYSQEGESIRFFAEGIKALVF